MFNKSQELKFKNYIKKLEESNIYFKNLIQDNNISLDDDALTIYNKLPIITKDIIRDNFSSYISNFDSTNIEEFTTGTTGTPLKCIKSINERSKMAIELWKKRKEIDPKVNSKNFLLLYGSKARGKHNFFNFEEENLIKCFEFINEIKPRWICGSISAFKIYAQAIEKNLIPYNKGIIKYIELQGEYVDLKDRDYIEKIFNAKSVVHYGNRESWTIGYECKHGKIHPISDNLIINTRNNNELLITNLNLITMPIIKYNTGDFVKIHDEICACGCNKNFEIIDGRTSNIIKGTKINGNIFFKRVFLNVIKKNHDLISMYNVIQTGIKEFTVNIVKGKSYFNKLDELLVTEIKNGLGNDVVINIIYKEKIEAIANGKIPIFKIDFK